MWLALALAMSSTALVLPISGTQSPVGRAALSMLLFEDLALVPMLFLIGAAGRRRRRAASGGSRSKGALVIGAMLLVGRFAASGAVRAGGAHQEPRAVPGHFSLLVVILASLATSAVGLSPILGALIAGLVIAETEYRSEVEVVTAPFKGLALGVFLITVGMRHRPWRADRRLAAAARRAWPRCCWSRRSSPALLLRLAGARPAVAAETGLLMASPSETTLIVLGAAGGRGHPRPRCGRLLVER